MKNIHIPTIDELMRPDYEVHGVLVGDDGGLKYYDLKEDKTYPLVYKFDRVTAITVKDDDVLYASGRKIKALFSGKKIAKENLLKCIWNIFTIQCEETYEAFALEEHKGTILDASKRGLETLEGKVLLSESQLEVCNIAYIASIAPHGNDLFALVSNKNRDSCFVKITIDQTNFEVDRLITYKNCASPHKAIIIPYGSIRANGKEYPFSALCSCADTLYLNENNVLKSTDHIRSFELKSLQGDSAEIIFPLRSELHATTLNLSNRTQNPPTTDHHGVFDYIRTLKAVKSIILHNKLVELGKKNVGKI